MATALLNVFNRCSGQGDDGSPRTVNIFFGFFLMVNLVLGTGFLGIPFAFMAGGLIAGAVTLLAMAVASWMCALWVLETMARAQAIEDYKSRSIQGGNSVSADHSRVQQPNFSITLVRKFEPSEQCMMFGGTWLKVVYLLLLTAITFAACLAYCTVAGSAWSVNLPLHFGNLQQCTDQDFTGHIFPKNHGCGDAYRFCLLIFACIVVPLTLLDLKEQAIIQFLLGVFRFVTVGAIVVYCIVQLSRYGGSHKLLCSNGTNGTKYSNFTDKRDMLDRFQFSGWLLSVPVFSYAFILHQAIPALTHPVKEKKWLRGYFSALYLILGGTYLLMGIVVSLWFRDCLNETCTLNWAPYTGKEHSKALRALSYFIILFPSIDVCSAFPLVVHTTVNNIYIVIFNRDTSQDREWKHFFLQRGMKLVAAIVPIFVGIFVSNLVSVLNYAGLIGYFISFFFPVILHVRSQWICHKLFPYKRDNHALTYSSSGREETVTVETVPLLPGRNGSNIPLYKDLIEFFFTNRYTKSYTTPYSTFFSHPIFAMMVAALAALCFILTVVSFFVKYSVHSH